MTVQTVDALEDHMYDMCKIMVTGEPVLVLGPGCQRIGYDRPNDPAWSELRRRMRLLHAAVDEAERPFLEQLWRSKLSDTTLREQADGGLPPEQTLDAEDSGIPLLTDDIRIRGLAAPLLKTLILCTRYLGQVIETGETPVLSWQSVKHPEPSTLNRSSAGESFQDLVDVARALRKWNSNARQVSGALTSFGFGPSGKTTDPELAEALPPFLQILEIDAIALSSEWFAQHILAGTEHTLSGANIEWLADLLWHLLACDAGVFPSQSELAFCVNLRDHEPWRERLFTRARPGEYRDTQTPESQTRHALLTNRIGRRLDSCAINGLEGRGDWDLERDQRVIVNRTLAATLLQMWRTEGRLMIPLALVNSHDLMLERQLYELLEPEGVFHTVVPVWVSEHEHGPSTLTWLWGTYEKDGSKNLDPEDLRGSAGGLMSWGWYRQDSDPDDDDGDGDDREVEGPVIVRTGGSPLLDLGENATTQTLGLGPRLAGGGERVERVELATIFSEFDSLAAIITFAGERQQTEDGPASAIVSSLAWERRSWAFFGDSFPDWIPRVRLLFNARTVLSGRSQPAKRGQKKARHGAARLHAKVALDLAFDWPEQAMLEALSVRPLHGDLQELAQYPHSPVARAEVKWRPFLNGVRTMQRDAEEDR